MLVATLVLVAVVSTVLVGVMAHVSQEHKMLARTATWNSALPVAEAALEEAMSHMWWVQLGNRAVNGWTVSGTNVARARYLTNSNSRYSVAISSAIPPIIYSTGAVWCASANKFVERRIQARTRGESYFMKGIQAKQKITMSGQISVDSFHSDDPLYSTNGLYTASKKKAGGDVGTNLSTPDAIDMGGQAKIYGKVATGPLGTVKVGGQNDIGSIAHVDGAATGIQAGWYTKDMNVSHPNVVVPTNGVWFNLLSSPVPQLIGGVSYKWVLTGGNYNLPTLSLSAGDKMLVTGTAILVVNLDMSVSGTIILNPGANLQIYLKSGSISLSGNGLRNDTGRAYNFGLWCLPAVSQVNISGDGHIVGTVYAPSAVVSLSGGGSGGIDFVGAIVGNSVNGSGSYTFHYDEALKDRGMRNLVVVNWKEI
ncbi:MAG TPA: collagen-binding domain-containing protein [Verrucomicrobiae bacterium]